MSAFLLCCFLFLLPKLLHHIRVVRVGFFDTGCPKSYFQSVWTSVSRKLLQYHNTTDLHLPFWRGKRKWGKLREGEGKRMIILPIMLDSWTGRCHFHTSHVTKSTSYFTVTYKSPNHRILPGSPHFYLPLLAKLIPNITVYNNYYKKAIFRIWKKRFCFKISTTPEIVISVGSKKLCLLLSYVPLNRRVTPGKANDPFYSNL